MKTGFAFRSYSEKVEIIEKIKEVHLNYDQYIKKLDIGRNDLCLCGSGKKYKKCCGK